MIFKINIKGIIFLCTLFVIIGACKKNETEEKWAEEEKKLADWIKENEPDLLPINGGIYLKLYPEYEENIHPEREQGDYVLVDFTCRFMSDGVCEEVSYKNWQDYGARYPSKYKEGGPELWDPERWASMGIGQMHENEWARVYVPSRLVQLQDFKTRVYDIHLRKVIIFDIKTYQEDLMGCYMKQYGEEIDTITIEDNKKYYSVLYHITKEGTGSEVSSSSVRTTVSEYYFMQENDDRRTCYTNKKTTGCNGNVSKYSSKISEMFVNKLGRRNKPVKKGGSITAVMPYKMMYGDELKKDANGQFIAPINSILLYEISIDN